jgi:hypothetical protein
MRQEGQPQAGQGQRNPPDYRRDPTPQFGVGASHACESAPVLEISAVEDLSEQLVAA